MLKQHFVFLQGSFCCGYGNNDAAIAFKGYDCVMVPGASTGGAMALMKAQSICGRLFGTKLVPVGPDTTAMHASVCCKISCL